MGKFYKSYEGYIGINKTLQSLVLKLGDPFNKERLETGMETKELLKSKTDEIWWMSWRGTLSRKISVLFLSITLIILNVFPSQYESM